MPSNKQRLQNLKSIFFPAPMTTKDKPDDSPRFSLPYKEWQSWLRESVKLSYDRKRQYKDYMEMDRDSVEIEAALDIYADDATNYDWTRKTNVWIESGDSEIKKEGKKLIETLKLKENLWAIARALAKSGDNFERPIFARNPDGTPIIAGKTHGISQIKWADPRHIDRVEDRFSRLRGFRDGDPWYKKATDEMMKKKELSKSFQDEKKRVRRDPWDIIHFRMLGKDRGTMYGSAMIEAARNLWKYLELLNEVIMITRLSRAATRRIYYVDVGEKSSDPASWKTLKFWRDKMKKRVWIDPASGEYRSIHDPRSPSEDLFWPVRGQKSASRVEEFPGIVDVKAIADIEFMWTRLFIALKIPPAYFNFSREGMGGGMGSVTTAARTLAMQDIRYARTIKRLQKDLVAGLHRLFDIHFALIGMPVQKFKGKYDVVLTPVSTEEEIQRNEVMSGQLGLASQMGELVDRMGANREEVLKFTLTHILSLSKSDVKKFMKKDKSQEQQPGGGGMGGFPGGGGQQQQPQGPEGGGEQPPEGGEKQPPEGEKQQAGEEDIDVTLYNVNRVAKQLLEDPVLFEEFTKLYEESVTPERGQVYDDFPLPTQQDKDK